MTFYTKRDIPVECETCNLSVYEYTVEDDIIKCRDCVEKDYYE